MKISILCVCPGSSYYDLAKKYNLELFDIARDAFSFNFNSPVIAHPPCPQWSRLHKFANFNAPEKALAAYCMEAVNSCGGIFEHPAGSHFFRYSGFLPNHSVDQSWWGFPCRKRTYLRFVSCSPLSVPLRLSQPLPHLQHALHGSSRSRSPLAFNEWLIRSLLETFQTSG